MALLANLMLDRRYDHRKNIEGLSSRNCSAGKLKLETKTINCHSVSGGNRRSRRLLVKLGAWNKASSRRTVSWPASSWTRSDNLSYNCVHYFFSIIAWRFWLCLHWGHCAAGARLIAAKYIKAARKLLIYQKPCLIHTSDFAIANAMKLLFADAAFRRHLSRHGHFKQRQDFRGTKAPRRLEYLQWNVNMPSAMQNKS